MSSAIFVSALLVLVYALIRRPILLYGCWPLVAVPLGNSRLVLGPAPFYLADVWTLALLFHLARQGAGPLLRIPGGTSWHWVLLLTTLPGIFVNSLAHGAALEMGFETLRYGLSWCMIPVGAWLCGAHHCSAERRALGVGMAVTLVVTLAMLAYEQGSPANAMALKLLLFGHADELGALKAATRASGPFHGPNAMAGAGLMMGGICWLFLGRDRPGLATLGAGLAVSCSAYTLSRHALVSLAGAVPFALIGAGSGQAASRRLILRIAILGFFAAAATMYFGDAWLDRMEDKGPMTEDQGVLARVVDGPARLADAWEKRPSLLATGLGLGMNKVRFVSDAEELRYLGFASNGFLLALLYLGAGGLFAFVLMWANTLASALRCRRHFGLQVLGLAIMTIGLFTADNYSFLQKNVARLWALIVGGTLGTAVWSQYWPVALISERAALTDREGTESPTDQDHAASYP